MTECVILKDGSAVALCDLPHRVPHLCFQGDLHLDVCGRMAQMRPSGAALGDIYFNYLFVKSYRARQLTAMIALMRSGRLAIREIRSGWIGQDWVDLLGESVLIRCTGQLIESVGVRQLARFAAKCFSHQMFRILGRRAKASVAVRAWVDTTDAMLSEAVSCSHLLIYPFAGNILRQVRYIIHCRRKGRSFSLAGLPYGVFDVIRVMLTSPKKRVDRYCELEAKAYAAHAQELFDSGVQRLYSTDEFEIAASVLHGALIDRGAKCINASHGIAVYGPCIRYSHCRFHGDHQLRHYRRYGRFDEYDFHDVHDLPHAPREQSVVDVSAKRPAAVYLMGNWQASRKNYEARFEHNAIRALRDACDSLGIELLLKAHPNLGRGRRLQFSKRYDAAVLTDWKELVGRRPVFVNLLSTAYYDLVHTGPSLFLADELIDPTTIFGDHIVCATVAGLKAALEPFECGEYWRESLQRQIEDEKSHFKMLQEGVSLPAFDL